MLMSSWHLSTIARIVYPVKCFNRYFDRTALCFRCCGLICLTNALINWTLLRRIFNRRIVFTPDHYWDTKEKLITKHTRSLHVIKTHSRVHHNTARKLRHESRQIHNICTFVLNNVRGALFKYVHTPFSTTLLRRLYLLRGNAVATASVCIRSGCPKQTIWLSHALATTQNFTRVMIISTDLTEHRIARRNYKLYPVTPYLEWAINPM